MEALAHRQPRQRRLTGRRVGAREELGPGVPHLSRGVPLLCVAGRSSVVKQQQCLGPAAGRFGIVVALLALLQVGPCRA